MKSKYIFVGGGAGLLFVAILALLYQFGPPGIKTGEDRILSSTVLSNGSRIYVVAHRTGHLIDAYEVSLYRVDQSTNVFVCFLGHQEAFWWGSSLQASSSSDVVEIRAFWQMVANYSVSNGSVTWSDKKRGSYPSYKIDGVNVQWPVPKVLRL